MLALEVYRSPARQLAARAVGGRLPGLLVGAMAPVRLVTRDRPATPGDGWALARPVLAGICGWDLAAIGGSVPAYFSSLVSTPSVPGHEVVAELLEDCGDVPRGSRVVLDPVLACAARGLAPCPPCAQGDPHRCDRVTVGHLAPGLSTGSCRDTGGGWGEQLVVHRSQLHVVPDGMSDERAVLAEPLACAVHLARRAQVARGASVLVVGAGALGLLTVLALRQLTTAGRITVVAQHEQQAARARALGASDVVRPAGALRAVRRSSSAMLVGGSSGPTAGTGPGSRAARSDELLLGGVDVAVDAAGTRSSLDAALRATRAGGRVVLGATPRESADLAPVWYRELSVVGARSGGGDAFDDALALAASAPLDGFVGGRYPLYRWREALDHAQSAGRLDAVRVCFEPRRRT